MARNPMLTTRVDPTVVERIDRLIAAQNGAMQPGERPIDRGGVLRACILRALPILERARARKTPKTAKKRTPHARARAR